MIRAVVVVHNCATERKLEDGAEVSKAKHHRGYSPLPLVDSEHLAYRKKLEDAIPRLFADLPDDQEKRMSVFDLENGLQALGLWSTNDDEPRVRERQEVLAKYLVRNEAPWGTGVNYRWRDSIEVHLLRVSEQMFIQAEARCEELKQAAQQHRRTAEDLCGQLMTERATVQDLRARMTKLESDHEEVVAEREKFMVLFNEQSKVSFCFLARSLNFCVQNFTQLKEELDLATNNTVESNKLFEQLQARIADKLRELQSTREALERRTRENEEALAKAEELRTALFRSETVISRLQPKQVTLPVY